MKTYEPDKLPLAEIDWTSLVQLIGKANFALARYDGMLRGIINPAVLLSPLTTQEAVLSSRIEGTYASMEEVLEYEANPNESVAPEKRADIQEVINYRKAMIHAVKRLESKPLCLNLVLEIHEVLLDSVRGLDKSRGRFRQKQNYIGPAGTSIDHATFVPPAWEKVATLMDNWEKYIHLEEKDFLVQLAIVKAQFELIHPFLDGNGRVGRILVPLFLFEKKLLSSPMFYVSSYLEAHRDEYYTRLRGISHNGDWNGWISFFLQAIIEQSQMNAEKTQRIIDLYERTKREVPKLMRSGYLLQAIDALFDQPVFRNETFIETSGIPKYSAIRILNSMKEAGFVRVLRQGSGRRSAIMVFSNLLDIVDS